MYNKNAALAKFSSGDVVSYGESEEETGAVLEVLTSDTTVPYGSKGEMEIEASQGSPAYVVAKGESDTIEVFPESELSSGEINIDDLDNPASDLKNDDDEEAANEAALDWSYPSSWRKSNKPNRLILLDAWTSMGGTFSACYPEYGGKRFCASMKDKVWGTTRWRNRF